MVTERTLSEVGGGHEGTFFGVDPPRLPSLSTIRRLLHLRLLEKMDCIALEASGS